MKWNYPDLALANVEALANDESGGSTFYCCGNTSTCAKGKDQMEMNLLFMDV